MTTLTLEVRGTHAAALGVSARRQFGPTGGVIGRASTCDWVLPHANVSARHAYVRFAGGVFYLEDVSRNGVFVNRGRERLEQGRPHPIRSGDEIFIDPYDIRVTVSSGTPAPADPDDSWDRDPFGSPVPRSIGAVRPDLGVSDSAAEDRELDPLKLIGGAPAPAARARRPQARDLEAASPIAAHYRPPPVQAPPPPAAPIEIPEDYNPLADSGAVPRLPRATPPAANTPPPRPARPEPPGLEPLASPATVDPWDGLPSPVAAEGVVLQDQGPEPAAAVAGSGLAAPEPTPDPFADLEVGEDLEAPPPAAASEIATGAVPAPGPEAERRSPSHSRPAAAATSGPRSNEGELAAVLLGAGLEGVEVTDELARDFGRILRVVVSGVMDILRARQQIKDEFRMRMTQFRPAENNPLKFSANVEDALHNLLVKRNAAYLQPVDAFEDAFADLRGHQLAMLAGMRVAFDTMLAEFNPERLQEQFDRQLKKGALLTVPAKLRYWELYRDYSENLVKDTEAAFRKLFGEAFASAYEEQLNRLKAERRAERRDG